jgi:hypothetical protein
MGAITKMSDFFLNTINTILDSKSVPLQILPVAVLVGAVFLIFGSRIFKVVIIVLMFVGGGILAYLVSHKNWIIVASAAVGAGLIAYPLHYLFGVLLTGVAFGGIASQVIYYLVGFEMSLLGFAAGLVLGIALAVIFFKPAMIFTTSAASSAAITLSILLLVEHKSLAKTVALNEINLDIIEVSILSGAIFAAGIGIQSILAHRRKSRKKEPSSKDSD